MIQVRYRLNYLETGKGEATIPSEHIWGPSDDDPVVDFRDTQTVWVWLADDLCVELDRKLVTRLLLGFKDQDEL